MIYLNCAATSHDRPPEVAQAMVTALENFGSSGRGATGSELGAARTISRAREAIADLLGAAAPERVVLCANATTALNIAILGTVRPGDRVVATDWDHNSIRRPLLRLQREADVQVEFCPADRKGRLDMDALARLVTPGTRLVTMTHASNLTGNVADVAAVARIAHKAGALLLVDCAQSAGAIPFNMVELGADLVAFTGHKALMGPQGTGGLIVAPGVDVKPVLTGGTGIASTLDRQPDAYPEHLEAGTLNGHGIAGLAAGVAWVNAQGIDAIHEHDLHLVRRFVEGLRTIPGVVIYGDFPDDITLLDGVHSDHTPAVAINIDGWNSSEAAAALEEDYDIAVRAGIHCAPRMHAALGTLDTGVVRFSFGPFTTEEDIDAALEAVADLAKQAEED